MRDTVSTMKRRQRTGKGAPGIVEVAARAQVSPATVSRFFNNPKVVRPDTRKRIQAAATEMGYIRDRMAGAMHNRFSGSIGLVVPTIDNTIFSEMIAAFSNRLLEHDRTMLVASHNYDPTLEVSIIRSLLERRIDGVALVGQDHMDTAVDMLRIRSVPVIALWGYDENPRIPFVGANNALAGYRVTRHVIDDGHTNIAFLFPDTHNNDRARDRKNGALKALTDANIVSDKSKLLTCPYDVTESKAIAKRILTSDKPSAIVCGNDVIAHGVIYAAYELGIHIPGALSVAGIGDFKGSADIVPSLTTVRLPAKRIGSIAADTLVHMSESGEHDTVKNQVIETELIVRQSTGKLA